MELLKNRTVEAHRKGPVHELRDDDDDELAHSFSSSSSSSSSSGSSIESDSMEEETSSNFLPSSPPAHDSLSDMSSLLQQLPIKMGLSRHYEGKSRSFTSLASVRRLEDLGKEENAETKKMMMMKKKKKKKKKMKCCRRSYGGLWRTNELSRQIGKRECNSSRRRPPIPHPSHRSTATTTPTISNQTPLFA